MNMFCWLSKCNKVTPINNNTCKCSINYFYGSCKCNK